MYNFLTALGMKIGGSDESMFEPVYLRYSDVRRRFRAW